MTNYINAKIVNTQINNLFGLCVDMDETVIPIINERNQVA